jgi:hypothetical protein
MSGTSFTLPTPDQGFDGLEALVKAVGTQPFQQFVRWARDSTDGTLTDFIAHLAANEILELMTNNPDMTYTAARLQIAHKWGYSGTRLTGFYRYAERGRDNIDGPHRRTV